MRGISKTKICESPQTFQSPAVRPLELPPRNICFPAVDIRLRVRVDMLGSADGRKSLWSLNSRANICAKRSVLARKYAFSRAQFKDLEKLCGARGLIPHIADIRRFFLSTFVNGGFAAFQTIIQFRRSSQSLPGWTSRTDDPYFAKLDGGNSGIRCPATRRPDS